MGFISKKKKVINDYNYIDKDFASEIVEIFEEKLDELNITLPGIIVDNEDKESRIKKKLRNELISEIEDFIYSNKKKLLKKVA